MAYNLMKGNSRDIIDTNIKTLCDNGCSKPNATRIALRHARKKTEAERVAKKVADTSDVNRVRLA